MADKQTARISPDPSTRPVVLVYLVPNNCPYSRRWFFAIRQDDKMSARKTTYRVQSLASDFSKKQAVDLLSSVLKLESGASDVLVHSLVPSLYQSSSENIVKVASIALNGPT